MHVYKVWMFVYPIMTREPFDQIDSNLIGKLGRAMGMFLAWFKNVKLSG